MTDKSQQPDRWWKNSVGYQIYIRSFADSNDDGVGDLGGIESRLDYLAGLGVDFIWITPFYPSPMADWGYDVANYCDIDPLFGSLDDFDSLVVAAHQRNLKVLIDLVPNHSSDAHDWFQDALSGKEAQHRDYYIWADPATDGGYPNNWIGYFGGPAWTFDKASGQYYLHLFLPQQPDLNWRNPAVIEEFDRILHFWLKRGTDGFRIDVAAGLVKDDRLRSNPQMRDWDPNAGRREQWVCFEHRHDVFQPESHQIFRRWREICDGYDAYLLGETYTPDPQVLADLVPGDGMHAGFWFEPMHIEWNPDEVRRVITQPVEVMGERLLWATSSHDISRAPTRFTPDGRARTLAMNVLFSCLPGVLVLYQGEELGLIDAHIPPEDLLDPVDDSRDVCRTPMPWQADKPHAGFSTTQPWLKSAPRNPEETASAQVGIADSWHSSYARLLAAAKSHEVITAISDQPVRWHTEVDAASGPIVSYARGRAQIFANTADEELPAQLSSDDSGTSGEPRLAYQTGGVRLRTDPNTGATQLLLPAFAAAIVVD